MKRLLDIIGASVGLVAFGPVMLVVGLCVLCQLGRPIIFRQKRVGRFGRTFYLVKFRTMDGWSNTAEEDINDSKRLSPFGRFLRSTSLDELPELVNVLKGEMSLVGPRPLLVEYLDLYTPEQARRHELRPGITGWAQVNGRNSLSWEERFTLDVWYIDNQSFWLDIRILFWTVVKVFKREGISQEGCATMEKFRGVGR